MVKFMPVTILGNNRGIALLITLTVITVLVVAALELNRRARSAVFSTAATRDRITLSQTAASGIHIAMAILAKDKKEPDTDSLQEDWADPEKISEILQDIPFEEGSVALTISDELGRIQANALVKFPEGREADILQIDLWDRFLRLILFANELDEVEPVTIVNSVKDWLDSGDDDAITGLTGAESDYYQDIDPPYSCRNGPFTHIDELLLVRGVTPELFYGVEEKPGISRYMTVYGVSGANKENFSYEGKININTAELPVLTSLLPPEDEDLAQLISEYRSETSDGEYIHDLSSLTWYKDVPGCSGIEIDPKLITTSSDLFRIESSATLHEMRIGITAVVHREKEKKTGKWKCRVLSWETG